MDLKDWMPIIAMAGTAVAFVWSMRVNQATTKVVLEALIKKLDDHDAKLSAHSDAINEHGKLLAVGGVTIESLSASVRDLTSEMREDRKIHKVTQEKVTQIFYHLQSVAAHAGHTQMQETPP